MKKILLFVLLGLCSNSAFCQIIKTAVANYVILQSEDESIRMKTIRYSIENDDTTRLLLFITEDSVDSCSRIKAIKRKVLRRYGDFSLSMLLWDNVLIKDTIPIVPAFFVKSLAKGETFDVIIKFKDTDKFSLNEFEKHILICRETDFLTSQISMPNFIDTLKALHMEYSYSYIVFNSNELSDFIDIKSK